MGVMEVPVCGLWKYQCMKTPVYAVYGVHEIRCVEEKHQS